MASAFKAIRIPGQIAPPDEQCIPPPLGSPPELREMWGAMWDRRCEAMSAARADLWRGVDPNGIVSGRCWFDYDANEMVLELVR